jgi:hypothetical protein
MDETEIFEGKTMGDLFKEIHGLSSSRRTMLMDMIRDLKKLITDPDSATVVAPMIGTYLDILIRNDEHLIKLATVVQRIISAQSYKKGGQGSEDGLTEEDKKKLFAELSTEITKLDEVIKALPVPESR